MKALISTTKVDVRVRSALIGSVLLFWNFLAVEISSAGTLDIGGGAGIVCRDAKQKVVSAELLDLYEAEDAHGLKISESNLPYRIQVEKILGRLEFFASPKEKSKIQFQEVFKELEARSLPLKAGKIIERPQDIGRQVAVLSKAGCAIEGIGYRQVIHGKSTLRISQEVFAALSETHKAGFYVHEVLYAFYQIHLRKKLDLERGTLDVRHLVASLFSAETELPELIEASRFLLLAEQEAILLVGTLTSQRIELVRRQQYNFQEELFEPFSPSEAAAVQCRNDKAALRTQLVNQPKSNLSIIRLEFLNSCNELELDGFDATLQVNSKGDLDVSGMLGLRLRVEGNPSRIKELASSARYPL